MAETTILVRQTQIIMSRQMSGKMRLLAGTGTAALLPAQLHGDLVLMMRMVKMRNIIGENNRRHFSLTEQDHL